MTVGAVPPLQLRFIATFLVCASVLYARDANPPSPRTTSRDSQHEKLIAIYLDEISRYVEWPTAAASDFRQPFVIGVLDDAPLARAVTKLLAGKNRAGRTIEVVERDTATALSAENVHTIFIPRHRNGEIARIIEMFAAKKVLLIGESEEITDRGAMITVFRDGNHTRFKMNPRNIQAAGLQLHGRLLRKSKFFK